MALKHGLEKFGWQKFRHSEQGRAQEWHKDKKCDEQSESEFHDDDIALSNEDIAVFQSADHLLPQLQDEGLCSGIQLGLYRAFSTMGSFWRNNLVVILLPIGGQLGQRQAVFTILLRHGFEPRSIQGRVAVESGNPLQPLPMQELWYRSSSELVFKSSLVLDGQTLNGRSFLLGLVTNLPPARHWLDLDHRDLD